DATDPPAGQGLGAEGRPALRRRDRLVAVPAVARPLGPTRTIGKGCHQRPECAARPLRGDQRGDGAPPAAATALPEGGGFPGVPPADPRPLPRLAGVVVVG